MAQMFIPYWLLTIILYDMLKSYWFQDSEAIVIANGHEISNYSQEKRHYIKYQMYYVHMATLGWRLKMPTFFFIPNGQVMEIIVMANLCLMYQAAEKLATWAIKPQFIASLHHTTLKQLLQSHWTLDSVGHQATQVSL